jgi:hypothetical protein
MGPAAQSWFLPLFSRRRDGVAGHSLRDHLPCSQYQFAAEIAAVDGARVPRSVCIDRVVPNRIIVIGRIAQGGS